MDTPTGITRIDLLNDHNFSTWSIQIMLILDQKRVRLIVDGLDIAPRVPSSNASDAEREKFRKRVILFSERQGVARSIMLLVMERRLHKKHSSIECCG